MAQKIKIFEIELPPHLDIPREQVNEVNLRQYVTQRAKKTLPGDLEIIVQPQISGGWFVEVWEQPNLPECV